MILYLELCQELEPWAPPRSCSGICRGHFKLVDPLARYKEPWWEVTVSLILNKCYKNFLYGEKTQWRWTWKLSHGRCKTRHVWGYKKAFNLKDLITVRSDPWQWFSMNLIWVCKIPSGKRMTGRSCPSLIKALRSVCDDATRTSIFGPERRQV